MCLAAAAKSPARACRNAINALLRALPENTSSSMMVLSNSGLTSVINSLTSFLQGLRGYAAVGYLSIRSFYNESALIYIG